VHVKDSVQVTVVGAQTGLVLVEHEEVLAGAIPGRAAAKPARAPMAMILENCIVVEFDSLSECGCL